MILNKNEIISISTCGYYPGVDTVYCNMFTCGYHPGVGAVYCSIFTCGYYPGVGKLCFQCNLCLYNYINFKIIILLEKQLKM